ncbi:hypothetical protein EDB85DRAFT_1899637 [Lactarius pseudohatsudake]|nr:hypothetical protein EDB85DRAFT_1899637 [Lactarius pseudohatsudake]
MFHGLGSIYEIDSSITHFEQLFSTTSRSDPRRLHSVLVLASLRFMRYGLSNQSEDHDKGVGGRVGGGQPKSLKNFRFWAVFLVQRVHKGGALVAHKLSQALLSLSGELAAVGRMILPSLFIIAGALVMHSRASNQPDGVIYAAKYLHYLRDHPHGVSGVPCQAVTASLVDALACQVELESRNVMQCIEEMAVLCHELLTLEASDDDTTSSITCFARVVLSKVSVLAPDQSSDQVIECLRLAREHRPDVRVARCSLTASLSCRYTVTLVNDNYEEAASVFDELIASSSAGDDVAQIQELVTGLATIRSTVYSTPEYPEEAIYRARTLPGPSIVKDRFAEVTAAQRFRFFGSVEGPETSSGHSQPVPAVFFEKNAPKIDLAFEKLKLIQELHSEIRNPNITEIGEAVEKARTLLDSSAPTDEITLGQFYWFGKTLFEAFKRTNKIEYLNESISTLHQLYEHPSSRYMHFWISADLCMSSSLRACLLFFPGQDLDEIMELFSQCANNALVSLPTRFWYSLSLDYASYQVHLHQLEEAVETLERGRALLGLKCVTFERPQLGHEFVAISKDLEELTKSIPPSHKLSIDDDAADNSRADDLRAVDPFGRLLLKQCQLLKEHDNLTSRIRALPGFDSFLTPPSFDTLRSAATSGPVIIINHSMFRSDILILLHNASPSLIPTVRDFYDRAGALKDSLLDSQNRHGLDSNRYDETLASVLVELYDLVGKPVIDRLDQLQVPRQSRIWWCPTSVFCSLPLHAMGPIPSDDHEKRYFLDLYICSYTPTLSALIQSRNRDSGLQSSDRPSLLLVAQPDSSLPTVGGEIQVVQSLDTKTGKPFEAGFELYGERLSLLEIVRSHLPTAEFAFLSACHTCYDPAGSLGPKAVERGESRFAGNKASAVNVQSLFAGRYRVVVECPGRYWNLREAQGIGYDVTARLQATGHVIWSRRGESQSRVTVTGHVRAICYRKACTSQYKSQLGFTDRARESRASPKVSPNPSLRNGTRDHDNTAEVTEGSVVEEGLHLAAAVQYCGFRSVVGTTWSMVDEDGWDLAKHFYKALFSNSGREQGVPYHEGSAKALQFVVKKLWRKRRITLERWVNFVHYGA